MKRTPPSLPALAWALFAGAGAAGSAPALFFTDLESGPNAGGKDNKGAVVTAYGRGFGAARGASTVTIGGGAADNYLLWSDTRVAFQLGAAAKTGNIVVSVDGAGSSGGLPFTVRAGAIYFVAPSGLDGNTGSYASPWKTLVKAKNTMTAGDIAYAMDGVAQTGIDSYNASLSVQSDGASGQPIALVAWPGATVTVGTASSPAYGVRIPNIGVTASHWVLAGLTVRGASTACSLGGDGAVGWRVVGCDFSAPNGDGASACFEADFATHLKLYGNTVHDVSVNNAATVSKLYHAVYLSTDCNHMDVGWNTIRDSRANRGIQFHSSPQGGTSGQSQYDLSVHDNVLHDIRGDGINFATVDPSKGPVRAFNNVLCRVGTGPDFPEGGSDYAGIYVAGITNTGADGTGTVEVDNNTIYDCGSRGGSAAGAFSRGDGCAGLVLSLTNNIVVAKGGEAYVASGSATSLMSGNHNLFFGAGNGPAFLAGNVNADPLFVSAAGSDFHVQAASPAVDAGADTGLLADLDGTPRPQGAAYDIGAYEVATGGGEGTPPPGGGGGGTPPPAGGSGDGDGGGGHHGGCFASVASGPGALAPALALLALGLALAAVRLRR